jgi:formate hydrogenlyase subunit 3/multisubunit Na+/H+ antiporter MnhD subunit
MTNYVLLIALAIAAILNIAVSIFIARRDDLEKSQKAWQILIIWLVPYIAAIGLWLVNRGHDIKRPSARREFGEETDLEVLPGAGGIGGRED